MSGTVLISVQNLPLLDQIRDFLTRFGYGFIEAPTPSEALHILDRSTCDVDLMLADAPLPDAPRLAHRAVLSRPGLKVLLISGEPNYINRALMPDPQIDFIEKPFAWCDLSHAIDGLLAAAAAGCERAPALRTL